ncbi:basic helix-loop-helix DNA-binding superfamily protein [Prunus dulcis]|uniref:Basic helix-loop-helix DNA-binding superfamily protein n=1 Tax=Prunus dulcis TaxID=3755 RepID=A0A4Y1QKV2_PRUDU|nr:basic helix-loop-helix DNA-binding superfamily protein [Prunus dulcis]
MYNRTQSLMYSLMEEWIEYLDYIDETTQPSDFLWPNDTPSFREFEFSAVDVPAAFSPEKECPRKRGRTDSSCPGSGAKACREKFVELSAVLEPGRPPKSDKPAILDDAIRVLTQLRAEAQELKETNQKLLEEVKSLKAEKNELREEKLVLKADKERLEQQLKGMAISPSGFVPTHPAVPAAYHPGASKMAMYPSYSLVPMWHYLPPSVRDTSRDHELRPPAA